MKTVKTRKEIKKRKNNHLENYDYSSPGSYFITLCTLNRCNYFWEKVGATIGRPKNIVLSQYGRFVDEAIKNIPKIYSAVTVDHYVIMPDHIHLLLTIHADEYGRPMVAPTIGRVMRHMKGYITKQIGFSVWQKLYSDHIIRNQQDYNEHVQYIYDNPSRWIEKNYSEEVD